jgi:hypothetical protein
MLDQSALSLWSSDAQTWGLDCLMKTTVGGQAYIDIFNPRWADQFVPVPDDAPTDNREYLKAASVRIRAGLSDNRGNGPVLTKYEWLAAECAHHQVSL